MFLIAYCDSSCSATNACFFLFALRCLQVLAFSDVDASRTTSNHVIEVINDLGIEVRRVSKAISVAFVNEHYRRFACSYDSGSCFF